MSFDAPEHPADIDDDLNWELDDIFAAEAAPEPTGEEPVEEDQSEAAYADEEQPEAYAEDGQYGAYAEAEQPARRICVRHGEEPAPIEFEDDDFDLSPEDIQPEPPEYYGDALAGAAIGAAAASRFDSGFARVRSRRRRAPVSPSVSRPRQASQTPSARIATRSCAATR